MKSCARATLLLVAALGLAGCAGGTAAPESVKRTAEAVPTASAGPSASDAPQVKPVKVLDPETVKSRAITNGRPIVAFDIECQVWKTPIAGTDEQAWANKLNSEFLESNGAKCPDQITFPHYFIESFGPGAPGELVVVAEDDLDRVKSVDIYGEVSELTEIATAVLSDNMDANPDVKTVTATLPPAGKSATSDRREVQRVRAIRNE